MQVTVNGISSSPLQFPVASANPSLFVIPGSYQTTYQEFAALALNGDGSLNSSTNPARLGSGISVFVNGLPIDPYVPLGPPLLYAGGGWLVTNFSQPNPFVLKVDLQVPSSPPANLACQSGLCIATFTIRDFDSYAGIGGLAFGGTVYVTQ